MLAKRLLRREFSLNPLKTVIRSESQNVTWSHTDFEKHTDAFSTGIQELGFGPGKFQFYTIFKLEPRPRHTCSSSKRIDVLT
jgi:hypothetical protein